jgi:Flp pilus assembly protein TadG
MRPFIRFLRRFGRDEDGLALIETAIIAVPLFAILFALAELLTFLTLSLSLEAATDVGREIRTGQFQTSGAPTRAQFKTLVCSRMAISVGCQDRLSVEVRTFESFGDAAAYAGRPVQDFEDIDLDDAGAYDSVADCFSIGRPRDIVMVRTYYRAPLVTPLFAKSMANIGGERLLTAATTFRNEPYNNEQAQGADGCYAA